MSTRHLRWLLPVILVLAAVTVSWFAITRPDPAPTPTPPTTPAPVTEATLPRPDPAPPDPRLTFNTPFRNVRPNVKYVGDSACVGCHADIGKHYRDHPMGRSAEFTKPTSPIEKYDAPAKNPFPTGAFAFQVEPTTTGVLHRVTSKPDGLPLEYVTPSDLSIGSGTHGRSYAVNCDGAVWQSSIGWYTRESRWDLSPGFDPRERYAVP